MRGPYNETKSLRHGFRTTPPVPGFANAGVRIDVQHPVTGAWIECPLGQDYSTAAALATEFVATHPELKGYEL